VASAIVDERATWRVKCSVVTKLTVAGSGARLEHSIARLEEIVELGRSWGETPVVGFDVPEMVAEHFMRHACRRISIRLVIQDLHDQAIMIGEARSAETRTADGRRPLEHRSPQTGRLPRRRTADAPV